MKRYAGWLVFSVITGLCLATGGGFIGFLAPPLDALSHLRFYFAGLLLVAACIALALRQWPAAIAGLAVGIAALVTTWPDMFPHQHPESSGRDLPVYSLLQMNLRHNADNKAEALRRIGEVQPDIITMQEVSLPWRDYLTSLEASYPYHLFCQGIGAYGAAIFSRRPFAAGDEGICDPALGFAARRIDLNGTVVQIVSHHQEWPWPWTQWPRLARLGPLFASTQKPLILAGDFNAVRWSAFITAYEKLTGASALHGIGPTYLPVRLPVWLHPLGLPIDNILVTPEIRVMSIQRLAATGSDHLPVLLRFSAVPRDDGEETVLHAESRFSATPVSGVAIPSPGSILPEQKDTQTTSSGKPALHRPAVLPR